MKKLSLNSFLFLCMAVGYAQDPQYKAGLSSVATEGFYRLELSPEIVAKSLPDLADIRLRDQKGNSVPYIIKREAAVSHVQQFVEFPFVSSQKEKDLLTHVVFRNSQRLQVSELQLHIANTEADRTLSISGSDDSLSWFVIKEDVPVERSSEAQDQFVHQITLPLTAYAYYKIIVNGKNLLPVRILKAGAIRGQSANAEFQAVPGPQVQTETRQGVSYASLFFKENYQIDQLTLRVSGQRFFKREVRIFDAAVNGAQFLGAFAIRSGIPIAFPLQVKTNKLRIEIVNEDSPPLLIDTVQAFQLKTWVAAYLKPGERYEITFGDSSARSPRYDLSAFSDSVERNALPVTIGVIEKSPPSTIAKTGENNNRQLLWIVTGIILVILLIVTFRMIREMNKKQDNQTDPGKE